jgi:hypothetical protein
MSSVDNGNNVDVPVDNNPVIEERDPVDFMIVLKNCETMNNYLGPANSDIKFKCSDTDSNVQDSVFGETIINFKNNRSNDKLITNQTLKTMSKYIYITRKQINLKRLI